MDGLALASNVWVSPKLDLFASARACRQGCGGRARADIAEGELLLRVPLEACLTPLVLPDDAPEFVDEQQKLMLRLLHELLVRGHDSHWTPYMDTLPKTFPTLPLWFTTAELRMLRGTLVDEKLAAGGHIADPHDLQVLVDWCASRPDVFPSGTTPCMEELRWAASVVASRAFDSEDAGVVLAPFADALNHSATHAHTRMRDNGCTLSFWAERRVAVGEEVLNSYGDRGNMQWLLNGGFVERNNPFDELPITVSEILTSAIQHRALYRALRWLRRLQRRQMAKFHASSAASARASRGGVVECGVDRRDEHVCFTTSKGVTPATASAATATWPPWLPPLDDVLYLRLGEPLPSAFVCLAQSAIKAAVAGRSGRRVRRTNGDRRTFSFGGADKRGTHTTSRMRSAVTGARWRWSPFRGMLLRLVARLQGRYDTTLVQDQIALANLDEQHNRNGTFHSPALSCDDEIPPWKRRKWDVPHSSENGERARLEESVFLENEQNVLVLRIGQKRVIEALRRFALQTRREFRTVLEENLEEQKIRARNTEAKRNRRLFTGRGRILEKCKMDQARVNQAE
eukprot:TRINITY_DN69633_c0_g1_i1.p1 TRINITY_DN69633_c0_g1~~TRINITY_DN69633_c0_g1_i1.p1  ORF type:complete len:571 (-),score=76.52 TRINITY_DN69633_c0_g1_i1:23-1735(-)